MIPIDISTEKGQWSVSVFAEPPSAGTLALVVADPEPVSSDWLQAQAANARVPAACHVSPVNDGGDEFFALCCSASGKIHCCGHGLLAAAYVLHQQLLAEGKKLQTLKLYLPGEDSPLSVEIREGAYWLAMPRLTCKPCEIPEWAPGVLGVVPIAAAIAGGDRDYLILECDKDVILDELKVLTSAVGASTTRALIVTQWNGYRENYVGAASERRSPRKAQGGTGRTKFDYFTRYFAPQYGADEDPVTGSAHRVLADYWGQRKDSNRFNGYQCSEPGGVVETELAQQQVKISGRLKLVASQDDTTWA